MAFAKTFVISQKKEKRGFFREGETPISVLDGGHQYRLSETTIHT